MWNYYGKLLKEERNKENKCVIEINKPQNVNKRRK